MKYSDNDDKHYGKKKSKSKSKHKDKKHRNDETHDSKKSKQESIENYNEFDINPRTEIISEPNLIDLKHRKKSKNKHDKSLDSGNSNKKSKSERKRRNSSNVDFNLKLSTNVQYDKSVDELSNKVLDTSNSSLKSSNKPKKSKKHSKSKKSRKRSLSRSSDSDFESVKKSKKRKKKKSRKKSPDNGVSGSLSQIKRQRNRSRSITSESDFESIPHTKTKQNESFERSSDSDFRSNNIDENKEQKRVTSKWDVQYSSEPEDIPSEKPKTKIKKKTLDGTAAGLRNLESLKEEIEAQKRREAELFKKMKHDMSGRDQAPVIRDRKTGKKRNLDEEAAEKIKKQKEQEMINEKYAVWGRGLKQVEDHNEKMKEDLYEMSKPLARYADDEDLERELKSRERQDDPMLAYIKNKEIQEGKRPPAQPSYEGSFMPNRFGIKPGHRWDGVDRSNGYEKKWFDVRSAKKALEEEAYKWSTSDM